MLLIALILAHIPVIFAQTGQQQDNNPLVSLLTQKKPSLSAKSSVTKVSDPESARASQVHESLPQKKITMTPSTKPKRSAKDAEHLKDLIEEEPRKTFFRVYDPSTNKFYNHLLIPITKKYFSSSKDDGKYNSYVYSENGKKLIKSTYGPKLSLEDIHIFHNRELIADLSASEGSFQRLSGNFYGKNSWKISDRPITEIPKSEWPLFSDPPENSPHCPLFNEVIKKKDKAPRKNLQLRTLYRSHDNRRVAEFFFNQHNQLVVRRLWRTTSLIDERSSGITRITHYDYKTPYSPLPSSSRNYALEQPLWFRHFCKILKTQKEYLDSGHIAKTHSYRLYQIDRDKAAENARERTENYQWPSIDGLITLTSFGPDGSVIKSGYHGMKGLSYANVSKLKTVQSYRWERENGKWLRKTDQILPGNF